MSRFHPTRAALLAAAVVAALAIPVAASASTSTTSPTAPGSVTVSLTSPVARSATRAAGVVCSTDGSVYRAAAGTVVRDYRFMVSDLVSDYAGPGDYSSTARLTVIYIPTGAMHTTARQVTVDISGSGETASIPFSVTLTGARAPSVAGHTVAGSVSWACQSAS